MRFFSLVKTLSRDSLIRLCHLDYDREMALVAVRHGSGRPADPGRVALLPAPGDGRRRSSPWWSATPWQGQGLGRHLMLRLIEVAKQRGIKRLVGPVLRENAGMLQLTRELGFHVGDTADPTVMETTLELC